MHESCCHGCNLLDSSVMQTVAGAEQQFQQIAKIQSACLFPLKMPSLKNPDPGSLCKKWGVRVSHVEKPPVLAKKLFCDNPGCPILQWKFQGGYSKQFLRRSSFSVSRGGVKREGLVESVLRRHTTILRGKAKARQGRKSWAKKSMLNANRNEKHYMILLYIYNTI